MSKFPMFRAGSQAASPELEAAAEVLKAYGEKPRRSGGFGVFWFEGRFAFCLFFVLFFVFPRFFLVVLLLCSIFLFFSALIFVGTPKKATLRVSFRASPCSFPRPGGRHLSWSPGVVVGDGSVGGDFCFGAPGRGKTGDTGIFFVGFRHIARRPWVSFYIFVIFFPEPMFSAPCGWSKAGRPCGVSSGEKSGCGCQNRCGTIWGRCTTHFSLFWRGLGCSLGILGGLLTHGHVWEEASLEFFPRLRLRLPCPGCT